TEEREMGKQTDAKIAAIKDALAKWKVVAADVTQAKVRLDAAAENRDKAAEAHQAYYKKKGWEHNTPGREKAIDEDGAYKKLEDAFNECWAAVVKAEGKLNELAADAKARKEGVRKLLKDLNDFITKKEAEKVFAWQKSSVAGARAFIKEAIGEL